MWVLHVITRDHSKRLGGERTYLLCLGAKKKKRNSQGGANDPVDRDGLAPR